jgi:N-acetylmuramoyl-L-alanine amidase-like protein
VLGRKLSRRQALQAGAVAAAAGALHPTVPAFAGRRPALFELGLDGVLGQASAASAGGWRVTPVLRAPRRFDLVGLRWARGSRAEAMVRARRRGGRWTPWAALHETGDHAPDGGDVPAGTDPAFMGAADEFQLRLRGTPRGLRARFVRALPTASLARRLGRRRRARLARAGAQPLIISRSEWGGDSVPPRTAPLYGEVQLAFVHHTVTANDYGPEDSPALVLGIARYHRDGNGWNDIGYNFLVDKYGQVFEGRAGGVDQAVVGAQAQGYNSVSTGIACLGTFTSIAQSPEGMAALARLIGWKLSLHAIPTDGSVTVTSLGGPSNRYSEGTPVTFQRISGHRDGNATSCPGDVLYGQLADLRTAAAQFAGPVSGLTVFAARRVRGVKPIDVSGYLRFPDGSSPAGLPLVVEYRSAGTGWMPAATTSAGVDGSWRATITPAASGHVRAVFAGDGVRPQQVSLSRRIVVLAHLNLTLDRSRIRRGRVVTVNGTANPAERVRLSLERRVGRRWVRERRRDLRVSNGLFTVRLRPRSSGKYRITVQVGTVRRRRILRVV